MADALTTALAETMSSNPGMAAELMRAHVDDGTGHCAGCTSHSSRPIWPCRLRWYVARANEVEPVDAPRGSAGST